MQRSFQSLTDLIQPLKHLHISAALSIPPGDLSSRGVRRPARQKRSDIWFYAQSSTGLMFFIHLSSSMQTFAKCAKKCKMCKNLQNCAKNAKVCKMSNVVQDVQNVQCCKNVQNMQKLAKFAKFCKKGKVVKSWANCARLCKKCKMSNITPTGLGWLGLPKVWNYNQGSRDADASKNCTMWTLCSQMFVNHMWYYALHCMSKLGEGGVNGQSLTPHLSNDASKVSP